MSQKWDMRFKKAYFLYFYVDLQECTFYNKKATGTNVRILGDGKTDGLSKRDCMDDVSHE